MDNYYLVNNYLPIMSNIPQNKIIKDLRTHYNIKVKTIHQISEKEYLFYLEKLQNQK